MYFVGESSHKSNNIDYELTRAIKRRINIYVIKLDEKYELNECLYKKSMYSNKELINKDSSFIGVELKKEKFVGELKLLINDSDPNLMNNIVDNEILIKQYEVYLKTSEDLVSRRQSVSNFYISVNTALLTILSALVALINIVAENFSIIISVSSALFVGLLGTALCVYTLRLEPPLLLRK